MFTVKYFCQCCSSDAVAEYNAKKDVLQEKNENDTKHNLEEDKEDVYSADTSTPGFFAGVFSDQDTVYSERLV